jgi:hypothetical protein
MAIKSFHKGYPEGDSPHEGIQRGAGRQATAKENETSSLAHADGFVGPRVGEIYGSTSDGMSGKPRGQVPLGGKGQTAGGVWAADGSQNQQMNPSMQMAQNNGQSDKQGTGVGARQALTDKAWGTAKSKVYQHKGSGNFVETAGEHTNEYGTTATGQMNNTKEDRNISDVYGNRPSGSQIAADTENYTDVTDKVRASDSYKTAKYPGTR